MKTLARALLLLMAGLLWNGLAHAEGNCPPGQYPVGGQGWQGCNPIPGYGNQQKAPQRPAEIWQDRYGAIAGDIQKGVLGSATDLRSERAATDAAIADCRSNGGTNCRVELPFRNGCAAVLSSATSHNTSAGATLNEAIATGMKTCSTAGERSCKAVYTACSLPVRIQ